MKNVLHLLTAGGAGGIESLVSNYAEYSKNNNIYVFVWRGGENEEKIKKTGAKTYILNLNNKKALKAIKAVSDICKKENINVVITHHGTPLLKIIALYLKKRNLSLKYVLYLHSDPQNILKAKNTFLSKVSFFINKKAFNEADKVIAISEFVKKRIFDFFPINKDKVIRLYNAIPVMEFKCETSFDIHSPCKIIYVGRLIEEKGVQVTIQALRLLKEKDFEFQIIGDGPYKTKLESLVKEQHLENKVIFLGTRYDVSQLLEKADCRYTLVIEVSKRARQLVDKMPPLIDAKDKENMPISIAVDEVNRGLIYYERPSESDIH